MLELREAVDFINRACGRPAHTPLLVLARCQFMQDGTTCDEEFPMLPQDFNRAVEYGHPHICPECRPYYHRDKRRRNRGKAK